MAFQGSGPGCMEFRADYEPILVRIARSHSRNRESNGARMCMAFVDLDKRSLAWIVGDGTRHDRRLRE